MVREIEIEITQDTVPEFFELPRIETPYPEMDGELAYEEECKPSTGIGASNLGLQKSSMCLLASFWLRISCISLESHMLMWTWLILCI